MATLHLNNVPEELLSELEHLAALERVPWRKRRCDCCNEPSDSERKRMARA